MKLVYTIAELALLLHVSPATIHNWIKAGYLVRANAETCPNMGADMGPNMIADMGPNKGPDTPKKAPPARCKHAVTAASVAALQHALLEGDKLSSRANKHYRAGHDHATLSAAFLAKIWKNIHDTQHGDALGTAYEQALSNQHKNTEGVYYTPPALCADLLQQIPPVAKNSPHHRGADLSQCLFCDPCCGSGNFLVAALQQGIAPQHIYGFDIDPVAVEISRRRLFDRTGLRSTTIHCADFWVECTEQRIPAGYFDCIATNPPWGKKLPRAHRHLWATKAGLRKPVDSSGLFWLLACAAVKKGGYIALLVQEAFFHIHHFQELRQHILQKQLLHCIDYGRPFSGLISKAKAFIVRNSPAGTGQEGVQCRSPHGHFLRAQASFHTNPHTVYNISTTAEEQAIIHHMCALPHTTLQHGVRWGLGIVTGNNKQWLRPSPAPGYMPVYRGSDIHKQGLTAPSCYIPSDLSLYQQVAPRDMYTAPAKILYRFISTTLTFCYDTEQRFVLNSANMLITDPTFPLAMSTLADFLNSRIINWLYTKLFDTQKVLRSNLEYLPIYVDFLQQAGGTQGAQDQTRGVGRPAFCEEALVAYLGLEARGEGYRLTKKT